MKRATGPGKVETAVTPPGAPVQGVSALLYNFDFDDASVKPEHQVWLWEHAVPSLTAAPSTQVFLRGTASRMGDRGYNLQLSRRRVEAVRDFLSAQGVQRSQIVISFTGEDLSTSALPDDEHDRAVEAMFEVSTAGARFTRALPIGKNDGFDEESDPPTMVVTTDATRQFVRLLGAAGAVVQSTNPGAIRVTDPFRSGSDPVVATSHNFLLQLVPGVPGEADVMARMPQAVAGSLETAQLGEPSEDPLRGGARMKAGNFPPRSLTVSFHYVKFLLGNSQAAPPGVLTGRQQDLLFELAILNKLNDIFVPQANIRFHWQNSREVHNNGVQAPHVDCTRTRVDSRGRTDFELISGNGDGQAQLQIFFVGKIFYVDKEGKFFDVGGYTEGSNIVCQDSQELNGTAVTNDVDIVASTLAHEAGHALNEDHPKKDDDSIMCGGKKIPYLMAQRMNAFAATK
jgi:hypothetical protein